MQKGLVAQSWGDYRRSALPANVSAIQLSETEKAFYAGAASLFARLLLEYIPGSDPSDEDLAMMDAIHAELVAFARSKGG